MDLGKVHVQHVVSTVIIANLAASPVNTLDLDRLAILDRVGERD